MTHPVRIGLLALGIAFSLWFGLSYMAVGIDPLHQLAWGHVISEGVRPLLTSQLTPLSHPLPIFVGVLLAPFGPEGSFIAYSILSAGAICFLAFATYRLARTLAGANPGENLAIAAGALALALILIRPRFEHYALQAVLEIPFAALVMLAVALVAEAPRSRPWLPLGLLAVAGLLRPEVWVLGIAYCAWLAFDGLRGRELAGLAAIALAAPVIWLGFDLIVTDNPLNSIDPSKPNRGVDDVGFGTGDQTPTEVPDVFPGTDLNAALSNFRTYLGDPLALLALAMLVVSLSPWPAGLRSIPHKLRFALTAGVAVTLTAQNLILAGQGAPFAERYLFTPALMLLVLGCSAVWLIPDRRWAYGAAAALLVVVLAVNPDKPREAFSKPGGFAEVRDEQLDLYELAALAEVNDAVNNGCGRIGVGGRNRSLILAARPVVAMSLGLDLPRVKILRAPRGKHHQSNFRRDLPTGPPPYLQRGVWDYRSECLTGGEPLRKRGQ